MRFFSPAKINLTLAIHPQRADGFHELTSLVTPIAFGDWITLTKTPQDSLECNDPNCPRDPSNLALRALSAFRKAHPATPHYKISLEKNIPIQAGLGGGSGNASTVLLALNHLHGYPLSHEQLRAIAAELGSDCPLFLEQSPCIMTGRGEVIHRLNDRLDFLKALQNHSLLLFKPNFPVSTKEAFAQLKANPELYALKQEAFHREKALIQAIAQNDLASELLYNTFEAVIPKALLSLLQDIRKQYKLPALLAGSGSTCFVLLEKTQSAPAALTQHIQNTLGSDTWMQFVESPWNLVPYKIPSRSSP